MHKHDHFIKHLILVSILCGLGLCAGCGKAAEPAPVTDVAAPSEETSQDRQTVDSAVPDKDNSPQPTADMPEKESPLPKPAVGQPEENVTETSLSSASLTEEELQAYTELLQQGSNYGFLMSEWDKPTEVDLYEVFYNGAGISRDGTEAEIEAYLERNGLDELYTDFFVIDKAAVNSLLLEKIGLTYDEFVMKGGKGMEEAYYAESDSFCLQVGDTNYCLFTCTDGVKNEEGTIVTLHYTGEYTWIKKGEVRMWADGSSFCSNHILEGDYLDTQD